MYYWSYREWAEVDNMDSGRPLATIRYDHRQEHGMEGRVVMANSTFTVSVDMEANVAYIAMSHEPVASSKQITDDVLVDLDAMNVVVGVEVLRIDAEIPFQRLVDEFHVHSSDIELLRLLRPSVGAAVSIHLGADGIAAPARMPVLVG